MASLLNFHYQIFKEEFGFVSEKKNLFCKKVFVSVSLSYHLELFSQPSTVLLHVHLLCYYWQACCISVSYKPNVVSYVCVCVKCMYCIYYIYCIYTHNCFLNQFTEEGRRYIHSYVRSLIILQCSLFFSCGFKLLGEVTSFQADELPFVFLVKQTCYP